MWKCLNGDHTDNAVTNGWCQIHGAVKTTPIDDAAKEEAQVDDAAELAEREKELAKEAEERNQASIEAGKK